MGGLLVVGLMVVGVALALAWIFQIGWAVGPQGTRRAKVETNTEPRCGQCGYVVRGIMSLTCPECGGDLREVGIDTGKTYRPTWAAVAGLAVLWSILFWPVAMMANDMLRQALPRWVAIRHAVRMQSPKSGAYAQASLDATGVHRIGAPPSPGTDTPDVLVTLNTAQGQFTTLSADLRTGKYRYTTPDGRTVEPADALNTSGVLNWMAAAGIDSAQPAVVAEASEVLSHARAASRPGPYGGGWSTSGSGSIFQTFVQGSDSWSGTEIRSTWPNVVLPVMGVLLWLVGLWWIAARFGPGRRSSARPAVAA